MKEVQISIPALGEGVREARVVLLLKQAGENVLRDEPLAEVETDKANYVIESPVAGRVGDWTAKPGDLLPVGARLTVVIEANGRLLNGVISPRVRHWCSEQGLTPEDVARVPHPDARSLQVDDVERWLAARGAQNDHHQVQRELAARFESAWRTGAPAWIEMVLPWDGIEQARSLLRRRQAKASSLHLIAWCVIRAVRGHSKFQCRLNDGRLTLSSTFCLGVALAQREGDRLTTRVLECSSPEGYSSFDANLRSAMEGRSVAEYSEPHLHLSYLAPFGVESAVPVVVPPALATLFVGAPQECAVRAPDGGIAWKKRARMVLGFDHRAINGVGAAGFLRSVQRELKLLPRTLAEEA
jgi:2-oxoisovalerate dehydrogenase E1 component